MSALAALCKHQFTVDEYYRMAEMGFLRPDDRVELIEGEIIKMTPMGSRHTACVKRLLETLVLKLNQNAVIGVQDPIHLSHLDEPQPDVSVLKPNSSYYENHHPTSTDILLLIEVADTSLYIDRHVKFPLYARHGIQEAWLVDLVSEAIEVHRSPGDNGYRDVCELRGEDALAPLAFPDCTLTVNAILGKE